MTKNAVAATVDWKQWSTGAWWPYDQPEVIDESILDQLTARDNNAMPSGASNTSDIMYNPNTGFYHTVINNSGGDQQVYSVDENDDWTLEGTVNGPDTDNLQDTEGICWISGTRYAICEEEQDTFFVVNGASTEQHHSPLPVSGSNNGLEGIYYASEARLAQGNQPPGLYENGAMFGCIEGAGATLRIWRMEMPPFDGQDYTSNYPSSGDALATVTEFTAPGGGSLSTYLRGLSDGVGDMASIVFDPRNGDGRLIVLDEADRKLVELKIGGDNFDELTFVAKLDLPSEPQWEGLEIAPNGDYLVNSEPNTGSVRAMFLTYSGNGSW